MHPIHAFELDTLDANQNKPDISHRA